MSLVEPVRSQLHNLQPIRVYLFDQETHLQKGWQQFAAAPHTCLTLSDYLVNCHNYIDETFPFACRPHAGQSANQDSRLPRSASTSLFSRTLEGGECPSDPVNKRCSGWVVLTSAVRVVRG